MQKTPSRTSAKKELLFAGIALCALAGFAFWKGDNLRLAGQTVVGGVGGPNMPILGACTGREEEDLYEITREDLQFPGPPDVIDMWTERYHKRVEQIVDEYLANMQFEIDCLNSNVDQLVPPGAQMLALAAQLPPWENGGGADLSYVDTPTVLLEFLRTYECALTERYFFSFGDVTKELKEIMARNDAELLWGEVIEEYVEQARKIGHEMSIARPAMNRVLTVTSGRGRLKNLDIEAECFYRATMDLRNAMSLAAEASACFPRVQDTKDPLRDYE
jgi:hypothetical protein